MATNTNTYDQLKALINASSASKAQLRFQASSFSDKSASLFKNEFIGGLNLLKPTLVGKSTDTTFKLIGTSASNPFILDGLKVSVTIVNKTGLINGATATAPTTGGFKLLFNKVLPLLGVDYTITYSNNAYDLEYDIHLNIKKELAFLNNILKNAVSNPLDNFKVTASIHQPKGSGDADDADKTPYMVYTSSEAMSFPTIGQYEVKNVSFSLLTFVSWGYLNPTTKEGPYPLSTNTIQIHGDAAFDSVQKQMELTAQFPLNPTHLFLSCKVTNMSGHTAELTFNDLLPMLGGANLSQTLPSNIPFIDSFGLERFNLGIDIQSTPKLSNVHVGLSTTDTFLWEIIPGILALKKLGIDFGVMFSGTTHDIDASILGVFELDDNSKLLFNVSGTYPQYVFRAFSAWKKADAPSISTILSGKLGNKGAVTNPFNGNTGSGGTDPVIERISITVDAKNKSYSASLLIDPDINLSFGSNEPWFKVTELGFDIKYLKSNFSADLYGSLIIGDTGGNDIADTVLDDGGTTDSIDLYLGASYSKTDNQTSWEFQGGLQEAATFHIGKLLSGIGFTPASWFSSIDLTIKTLWLTYSKTTTTSPAATTTAYSFSLDVIWDITIPNINSNEELEAKLEISKTGSEGAEGSVEAIANFFGCSIGVGLEFSDGKAKTYTLEVDIEDELKVSGSYNTTTEDAKLTFNKIPSLGQVLTFLIKVAEPGMDLILPDPWDILNDIKIPGHITLDYNFKTKGISIEFDYEVDLVVVKLSGIKVTYVPKSATQQKKVMIEVKGSTITGQDFSPGWNALNPQEAPKVPGKVKPFELKYLAVGQHVSPRDLAAMNSVSAAIDGLAHTFNKTEKGKPGKPIEGTALQYDANAGWLIGADFSIIEVFEMGFVFLDPLLYGLLVGVKAKPSAKPFGGLHFEIMYKKVNDTTGVYFIYLTLPTVMRNLQFGEVSVTLPSIKLWVYTDGSFKIDFGFPYHNNWKDSFGLEVFPFVGKGGFYFGVLKGADVKSLPNTYGNGVFNPVIELGVALRVGLGKDINEGILSAGISLTVAGMLQGMMTFYHPKNGGDKSIYFTISAMLAIIGKIYGSINFAIISAKLNVTLSISARATFALYEPIHLRFKAYVSVELTVSIHLIFTIHVHLKFHATIKEAFTIGHSTTPPWGTGPEQTPAPAAQPMAMLTELAAMETVARSEADMTILPLTGLTTTAITKNSFNITTAITGGDELNLLFSPHYTTSDGEAQAILMIYIDSYAPNGDHATAQNSFANFGTGIVRWLATTILVADGDTTVTAINQNGGTTYLDGLEISTAQIQSLSTYFADNRNQPFEWEQAKDFLAAYFDEIKIQQSSDINQTGDYNATVFPMLPSLSVVVPTEADVYGYDGTGPKIITFKDSTTKTGFTGDELTLLNEYLQYLKVHNQNAADQVSHQPSFSGPRISTAQIIFVDFIAMMAKQVVQDSKTLFREIDVPNDGTATFTSYITKYGLSSTDYAQIIFENRTKALASDFNFQLATVTYQLKQSDLTGNTNADLTKIITNNFYGSLTAQDILNANPGIHKVKQGGNDVVKLLVGEIIDIPPFVQEVSAVSGITTLLDIGNHYHVTLRDTVAVQLRTINGTDWSQPMPVSNQDAVMNNMFATGNDNTLSLSKLRKMKISDLISSLKANSTFANLSGMTARFMMHGLQLPSPDDVQKAVDHDDSNPLIGLYQLTQQQIGVSKLTTSGKTMTVAQVDDASYKLSNLKIPNATYTFGAEDLCMINVFNATYSSVGTFPNLMLPPALFDVKEKHFALHSNIGVTTPVPPRFFLSGPVKLWKLGPHILQILQQSNNYTFQLYYKRQISQTNVSQAQLIDRYAPSTLLKFQVRRVKVSKESSEYIPNIYEVHSVDTESIRLLTKMEEAGPNSTEQEFRLMYPDKPIRNGFETPKQLIDGGPSNEGTTPDLFFVQSNLSEISNPVPDPTTPINQQITRYLLEAGVVHSGGYYMYYKNSHTQKGLPDHLFSEKKPDTEIVLLISYIYAIPTNNNFVILPYQNYIETTGQINLDSENLYLEHYESNAATSYDPAVQHKVPVAPPGTAGFEFHKPNVDYPSVQCPITDNNKKDEIVGNLFHLVSYNIADGTDFSSSQAGQPVGPMKQNEGSSHYTSSNTPPNSGTANDDWNYEAFVSAFPWLKNKPTDTDPNMPKNSDNPYNAIGKNIAFNLNWVDIFGNNLLGAPHTTADQTIAYTDAIVQLSEWPHMVNSYQILKKNVANKEVSLKANFAFNYAPFTPETNRSNHQVKNAVPVSPKWVHSAQNSLQKYKHIYYQYTAATHDDEPDMVMKIASTIGFPNKIGEPFDDSIQPVSIQPFINFIKGSYLFLKGISASALMTIPYQIPKGQRQSFTAIASANNITTAEQTAALMLSNEDIAFELLIGSTVNVPAYKHTESGEFKGLKRIQLFAHHLASEDTIGHFTATWLMGIPFFEVLNPDFAGKGGGDQIPAGTTVYSAVYNYTVHQENTTLSDVATALNIQEALLAITNPNWKTGNIPVNTVLIIPVPRAQVVASTIPVPEKAPFRFFMSTTTINDFSTYSSISAATIKALNPSLTDGNTIPANTQIIIPIVQKVVSKVDKSILDLLKILNPSVTFPTPSGQGSNVSLSANTSLVLPDDSATLSIQHVLDATWESLVSVVTGFGTSLELYHLFNPNPEAGTMKVPGETIVNIPVVRGTGNTTKPAVIGDFTSLTSVKPASTMLTTDFATSLNIDKALFIKYNPEATLLVQQGQPVYVPCSTYTILSDNISFDALTDLIAYTGEKSQIKTWLQLMNSPAGGVFNTGDKAKIPVPQPIAVETTETLDTKDNDSIFELLVKTQASRKTGTKIASDAPADVSYHGSYLNPDYQKKTRSGADTAGPPLTLKAFASEIETAMPGFKVATTAAKETDPDSRFKEIWLVNLPASGETPMDTDSVIEYDYANYTLTDAFYDEILSQHQKPTSAQLIQLNKCRDNVCWHSYTSAANVLSAAEAIFTDNWTSGGNYKAQVTACVQKGNASYYSIPPLSNYLVSSLTEQGIPIYNYKTGTYLGDTFSGGQPNTYKKIKNIDLESLMKDFLLTIDNFLFPEYAVPAFQLETEPGATYKSYSEILSLKDSFAEGIANSVQSVLKQEHNDAPQSVNHKILRELRIRLSNAYAFDAIGHLTLTTKVDLSAAYPDVYLHGKGEGEVWDDGLPSSEVNLPAFSVSPADIKLSKGETSSDLVFLFSTKQEKLQRVFPIKFNFRLNRIEHNIEEVNIQSSTLAVGEWLTFVIPFEETQDVNLKIPVPLRDFPQSPALPIQKYVPIAQQFGAKSEAEPFNNESPKPSTGLEDKPLEKIKAWVYEFNYKYAQASQDTLNIGISTSTTASPLIEAEASTLDYDLVDALVQFNAVYPALKVDLDKFLVQKKDTSTGLINTIDAVRSFRFIVDRVYQAYSNWWQKDRANYNNKNVTAGEQFEISTVEGTPDEYQLKIFPRPDQTTSLQPPIVIMDGYTSVYSDADEVRNIYFTKLSNNTSKLNVEKGQSITERTIRFDLDVFEILVQPWAKGKISITRNEELLSGHTTNPVFLYQSPEVTFKNAVNPILAPDPHTNRLYLTIDGKKPTGTHKLDDYLANFIYGLNNGAGDQQTIQIACYYAYTLAGNEPIATNNLQVNIPVIITTPAALNMPQSPNTPTAFITQVKQMIGNWFKAEAPVRKQAYFLFDISIFSTQSGGNIPILKIRDVQMELTNIDLNDLLS